MLWEKNQFHSRCPTFLQSDRIYIGSAGLCSVSPLLAADSIPLYVAVCNLIARKLNFLGRLAVPLLSCTFPVFSTLAASVGLSPHKLYEVSTTAQCQHSLRYTALAKISDLVA